MKPTIRFSHRYEKMPKEFTHTMLMAVFPVAREQLGELFVKYDTLYFEHDGAFLYELPKNGTVLVLLLISGAKGHVWTTIRRWTPDKEKYYRSIVGHDVDIEINGEIEP